MSFFPCYWAVFHALRHNEHFPWTEFPRCRPEVEGERGACDVSAQHKEEIVCVVVLVPDELAFQLHYAQVVPIELADRSRLPILSERRELLCQLTLFMCSPQREDCDAQRHVERRSSARPLELKLGVICQRSDRSFRRVPLPSWRLNASLSLRNSSSNLFRSVKSAASQDSK